MDLAPVISLGTMGDAIFAGTEEDGLYISDDSGDHWRPLAPDRIQGAVIQILVDGSDILAILEDSICFSGNRGKSWEARKGFEAEYAISSVAAPLGLNPKHPHWVGLSNGKVITF
jgi:hypothetical protein